MVGTQIYMAKWTLIYFGVWKVLKLNKQTCLTIPKKVPDKKLKKKKLYRVGPLDNRPFTTLHSSPLHSELGPQQLQKKNSKWGRQN